MKFKFISLFITLFCLNGCSSAERLDPLEGRETLVMPFETQAGSHELTAYLAQTEEEKAQGLMHVKSLPKDYGMIFIYDAMAQPFFWMKNMKISLDFVYLDDTGTVVDLLENIPPCTEKEDAKCEHYKPEVPSQYVVEVPAGWVEEVGLEEGDHFDLEELGR